MPEQQKYKSQYSGHHIDENIGKVDAMADYIVSMYTEVANIINHRTSEVVNTGTWNIRKWKSGLAECWGAFNVTGAHITSQWGSVYESDVPYYVEYPANLFVSEPVNNITNRTDAGWLDLSSGNSSSRTQVMWPVRGDPKDPANFTFFIRAIGEWKDNSAKQEIKVMSYNVELFGVEKQLSINSQQNLQNEIIRVNAPDIVGFQEFTWLQPVPDIATRMLAGYTYIKTAYDHEGSWSALGLASKEIPMENLTFGMYSNANQDPRHSARCYTKCYLRINGKTIAWFNTHLSFENDATGQACRRGQAEELYTLAMNEANFIITGDLNCQSLSENDDDFIYIMRPFMREGCHIANGTSSAGFTKTWGASTNASSSEELTKCFDTIITSPGISIKSVAFDTTKFNPVFQNGGEIDHIPIMATLEI